MNLIENNIDTVCVLCDQYDVNSLYMFGSILTSKFNVDSDIDMVVTFKPMKLNSYADNYFDFKFSLEDLLNRNIDLIEDKMITNPFLKQSIDATKQLIYGQRSKGLAV